MIEGYHCSLDGGREWEAAAFGIEESKNMEGTNTS